MSRGESSGKRTSPVVVAFERCRPHFVGVAIFSAFINVLMLTGSIYMMQVYDRVLSSRSLPTLVGISLVVLTAYVLQGTLEGLRSRMLIRIGARFDELLARRVYDAAMLIPLKGGRAEQALQSVRDLDQIRAFLSGMGPTALFDMPFMPIFFIGAFLLHPLLGLLVVVGGAVIIALTIWTDMRSKAPAQATMQSGLERQVLVEVARRSSESIHALGMVEAFHKRWEDVNNRHVMDGIAASNAAGGIGAAAKIFRMALQSAVLGVGAYLVIRGELSGGAMIAASILTSRALAPIEVAVGNWKGFVAARQSYDRLSEMLRAIGDRPQRMALPPPRHTLHVEDAFIGAPGLATPIVSAATLTLKGGQGIGIIGPSASGKSTLARAIVGVRPLMRGVIRLDGAALDQWDANELGRHLGYLPQDVELFDGTVAQNIARFAADATPEKIIAAARSAGAHDMVLRLADGYETRIGDGGAVLSGGQRQRVALARALYGDPFLVVLDEPNSSLDAEGDQALNQSIRSVRERGGIVIVVTHRPGAIAGVDLVAMMNEGRITRMGPKEEVLQNVVRRGGLQAVRAQAAASG